MSLSSMKEIYSDSEMTTTTTINKKEIEILKKKIETKFETIRLAA